MQMLSNANSLSPRAAARTGATTAPGAGADAGRRRVSTCAWAQERAAGVSCFFRLPYCMSPASCVLCLCSETTPDPEAHAVAVGAVRRVAIAEQIKTVPVRGAGRKTQVGALVLREGLRGGLETASGLESGGGGRELRGARVRERY